MTAKVPTDPNMTPEIRRFLESLNSQLDTAESNAAGLTQDDFISGGIKVPANQDYRIIEKAPFGMTLSEFTGKTSAGTLTATLKINTTAVTGGALSVTGTQSSGTLTAANAVTANDVVVITVSAVSSATDFSWVVKYSRTLDN